MPKVFFDHVPLFAAYALSEYYALTDEAIADDVWRSLGAVLDREMREQDWATFYWFDGFEDRRVAVVNANRRFAGLVGFVRLAGSVGDEDLENLGRALLAKSAVLRVGMAAYPRYLGETELTELPPQSDWQPVQTAGRGQGYIYNYEWTDSSEDARQVTFLDQFGMILHDHSDWETNSDLTAYRDMVPELARLLSDRTPSEAEIYLDKVEAVFPHWYAAFAESSLGNEHGTISPVDAFQCFLAKAWILEDDPWSLAAYIDIRWVHPGDLFYAHKLAETLKAYRGISWSNVVSLRVTPGDQSIRLVWSTTATLPEGATWQVEYVGPPGDEISPIIGIPEPLRSYTLTGLANGARYTSTVTAISHGVPLLFSDAVTAMPSRFPPTYLPLVLKRAR